MAVKRKDEVKEVRSEDALRFLGDEKLNCYYANVKLDDLKVLEVGEMDLSVGVSVQQSVEQYGVLVPLQVMVVGDEYYVLDGKKRLAALKLQGVSGKTKVPCYVWESGCEGLESARKVGVLMGLVVKVQERMSWGELWDTMQYLEANFDGMDYRVMDWLLQLKRGESLKLKEVMEGEYEEPREALLGGKKTLDGSHKALNKLRKEEEKARMELEQGVSGESSNEALNEAKDEALNEAKEEGKNNTVETEFNPDDPTSSYAVGKQEVGQRVPLPQKLRDQVLRTSENRCVCCGQYLKGPYSDAYEAHHVVPVHAGGTDALDNLVALCVTCHKAVHTIERGQGNTYYTDAEWRALSKEEQERTEKIRELATKAIEAKKSLTSK